MSTESSIKKNLLVVTAPSGSGKTTIVRHLTSLFDFMEFSISATTRKKREKEVDGVDYFFLTHEEFKKRSDNDEFVEWEEVYENQFYGTLKSEVDRITSSSKLVLFDMEVFGAESIKKLYGEEALTIYVAPPSLEELKNRLINRGTEDEESINKRLKRAAKELKKNGGL